jgi:IS5 family transposase
VVSSFLCQDLRYLSARISQEAKKRLQIMKPKRREHMGTKDFFKQELKELVDPSHRLCLVADVLNWDKLVEDFDRYFPSNTGRPATSSRLIAGLLYLKALYNLSDDQLIHTWVENPYWQYLCGEQYFQHRFPIDRSVLSHWRKRVGKEGIEKLLTGTLSLALHLGYLKSRELKCVNVDTTVQEKFIHYPTDSQLYFKARDQLVKLARRHYIPLRQSYRFKAKHALSKAARYGHAKQYRRMRGSIKELKNYLGRVTRDIERYVIRHNFSDPELELLLSHANRLLRQHRKDKNKLYSLHAPEVECIAKGKVHKPYEFGVKVGIVSTSRQGWILASEAFHGNPYDGHTLSASLDAMLSTTGTLPDQCFVDRGYRGHGEDRVEVFHSGQKRGVTTSLRRRIKRRSAIEPIIGHMKQSHGLDCCKLKGKLGDQINALLAAIGYNLSLILNRLAAPT